MFSSIKFRLIAIVVLLVTTLLGISPFVGHKVEEATIRAFEEQARREQAGLFSRLLENHFEGLTSWMRPWLIPENLAPLTRASIGREEWGASLLGIGNQIGVAFGVNQIISYNFDGDRLFNYRVSKESNTYAGDMNAVRSIVNRVIENEAIERGFVKSPSGETLFLLAFPAEDEEGELATVHAFAGSLRPVLKEFYNSTSYFTEASIDGHTLSPNLKKSYAPANGLHHVDEAGNEFIKRKVSLANGVFGAPAFLTVFVDVTRLNKQFAETRGLIYMGSVLVLCVFLPLFVGIVFLLLRPLSRIVGVTRDIAEGHYDKRVEISSRSEIGRLALSFNEMVDAIQQSDSNMKSLLAGITEGIFFFDREGRIARERSQALGEILPDSTKHNTLLEFFAHYARTEPKTIEFVINSLWDDSGFLNPFDGTVAMLPAKLRVDNGSGQRSIRIEYRELLDSGGNLDKVIVFVADVTEQLEAEQKQKVQAERIKRISMAAGNLESFKEFYGEAIGFFKRIEISLAGETPPDIKLLKRDLHTLKGNTATFEFTSLAWHIHELEDIIGSGESREAPARARKKWETIKDQWKFETTDIKEVLGLHKNDNYMRVDRDKVTRLQDKARKDKEGSWLDLLNNLEQYPTAEVFGKYERMMVGLAGRQEKSLRVTFTDDSSEISYRELQIVDGALVHIFRNCVDHGIETCDERESQGKPREGKINIGCFRKGDSFHLVIKDDGKGIDVDRLVEKAVAGGYWSPQQAAAAGFDDRINLIFAPSLSTAEKVTDTSGRGVGMDAVRTLIEDLGGKISVYSERGTGSQFEIDFPASGAAPARSAA